jgi:hypothetical protein
MQSIRTFKHSGNLGDIIYALPTIMALGGGVLYIASGAYPPLISDEAPHPYPVSSEAVDQMVALLKNQPYLQDVRPYQGETIDYDLDRFREHVVHDPALWRVHLAYWHLRTFHVPFDLCQPWLFNMTPNRINDIVVTYSAINATHSVLSNWRALEDYLDKCIFLGFENEYDEFKKYTGLEINFFKVKNIVDLARIIKGSRLFIGNQCFGFALAEAMKHPRVLLDVLRLRSNSLPQSCNGYIRLDKKIIEKYLLRRWIFSPPRFIDRLITKKMNDDYHKNIEGGAVC